MPVSADVSVINGTIQVGGVTEAFFSIVKEVLNCTYKYYLPSTLTFGLPLANGSFSPGLITNVLKGIYDITFPSVARASERDAVLDPTSPIIWMPVRIMAGRNQTRDSNMAGYLLTFDVQVWMLLLFFMVMLSIVLLFLDVTSRRIRKLPVAPFDSWNKHFWMLFENMFCEASAMPPQRTVLRIVSAVWWLAIVVLMNAFAGQMRACLLVKNELDKIDTLADIAARPHLKVYMLKNSLVTRYLQTSTVPAEQKVWSMIRRHNTDMYGLLELEKYMADEIVQEKAVTIHANMVVQPSASRYCIAGNRGQFYFGAENMYTFMFGVYMSRKLDRNLRDHIKRIVSIMRDVGIIDKTYNRAIPSLDRCSIVEEEEELRIKDVISIFALFAAFIMLSVLVFLAELVLPQFARRCRNNRLHIVYRWRM